MDTENDDKLHQKLEREEPIVRSDDTTFVETVGQEDELEPQEVGVVIIKLMEKDWDVAELFKQTGELTTQLPAKVFNREQAEKFFKEQVGGGNFSKILILLNKPTDKYGETKEPNEDIDFAQQVIKGQITDNNGGIIQIKAGVEVIVAGPEDREVIRNILNNNEDAYTVLGMPSDIKEMAAKFGKTAPYQVLGCKTKQFLVTQAVETPPNPDEIDTQEVD